MKRRKMKLSESDGGMKGWPLALASTSGGITVKARDFDTAQMLLQKKISAERRRLYR